jgi:hypothetical protein
MPLAEVAEHADIAPGTYEVELTAIKPDTITPKMGRDAGKEVDVYRWFLTDEDGNEMDYLTRRDPTSEKSNMFKAMVAFNVPRADMFTVEPEDITGRRCLATVSVNEQGYSQVDSLTPMPIRRRPATATVEPPVIEGPDGPVEVPPANVQAPAPAPDIDDLPF